MSASGNQIGIKVCFLSFDRAIEVIQYYTKSVFKFVDGRTFFVVLSLFLYFLTKDSQKIHHPGKMAARTDTAAGGSLFLFVLTIVFSLSSIFSSLLRF